MQLAVVLKALYLLGSFEDYLVIPWLHANSFVVNLVLEQHSAKLPFVASTLRFRSCRFYQR